MLVIAGEAGVDEAGCGSLMGDLVAAAVVLPEGYDTTGLTDSKKIAEKKRTILGERIRREAIVGIGKVTNREIDANSFAWARRAVFQRALDDLSARPSTIVVDGTGFFDGYADIPFRLEPRADAKYASVAAASIVAKTERDADVLQLCDANPAWADAFGWRQNKGYPSKMHMNALQSLGPTPYHRLCFAPCTRSSSTSPCS
jgi:ribonuclease HII